MEPDDLLDGAREDQLDESGDGLGDEIPEDTPEKSDEKHEEESRERVYYCPNCAAFTKRAPDHEVCSDCGGQHAGERHRQKRVLLVDDSEIVRKKIGAIVRKLGCHLFEAKDGIEALDQARRTAPDLIVLDINMPRMNGLEALKELRDHKDLVSTPVIMLTAEADASEVSEALLYGATDYIRKDTPVVRIIHRLREHVEA